MIKIPEFKSLDETVEFWETHDSTDYWEGMEEVEFDIHKNLLHPKLIILTHRPEHCPRCQHNFNEVMIEYVVLDDSQFLIIRDVPALRCQTNKHEYILEKTLDEVEYLLELERKEKLQPITTLNTPVFSLKMVI